MVRILRLDDVDKLGLAAVVCATIIALAGLALGRDSVVIGAAIGGIVALLKVCYGRNHRLDVGGSRRRG